MFPWQQVDDLWARKSKDVGLIDRALILQDFQPTVCAHDPPTLQTGGQTDRKQTCDLKTALCTTVHHAVKTKL